MAISKTARMMMVREARLPGRKMEIEYETWGEPQQRYASEPQGNWHDQPGMRYDMDSRGGSGAESRTRSSRGQRRYSNGRFAPRSNWEGGAESRMGDDTQMRMNYGPEGNYEDAESRFRDRRGREHYDDGRFAPMGNGGRYGPYAGGYGPFGRGEDGGDMRPIGFNSNWGAEMRGGSDASIPQYNEMERMPGNGSMKGGYMAGQMDFGKMDEQTAMAWVRGMKNEDGSKTPHWSMDQVRQVMNQKNIDADPAEFFAIMNSLYSDFDPIFKRHNVSTMDFYIEMTKAWLKDKDAVPNKAMAYYECIVKR